MAVKAMPEEAMILGSMRSESQPATGEKRTCMIGWAMSTSPACWGLSALIYCRYRLSRKVTADVAA